MDWFQQFLRDEPAAARSEPGGRSKSWTGQKAAAIKIWNAFIAYAVAASKRLGAKGLTKQFDATTATEFCDDVLVEQFAHFVTHDYTIPTGTFRAGEHKMLRPSLNLLNCVLQQAKDRFFTGATDAIKRGTRGHRRGRTGSRPDVADAAATARGVRGGRERSDFGRRCS